MKTKITDIRTISNPLIGNERVLFPTQVKTTFLERNTHLANAAMKNMASQFAQKQMASMKR